MAGTLWLVGTPIGNLGDLTDRARETLAAVDVIAAEDTRRTGRLLSSFGLTERAPMVSYFEGNEAERTPDLVQRLTAGADVALVTDGGMPGVSDPGYRLVRAAVDAGVEVRVVPGPSAVLAALVMSGLATDRFAFEGFLPRKAGERRTRLKTLAADDRTLVLFESPRRLPALLEDILAVVGDRQVAVARELTKLHEEVVRGRVTEVQARMGDVPPKGEVVVVLEGATEPAAVDMDACAAEAAGLVAGGMKKRQAARTVADRHGVSANDLYRALLDLIPAATPLGCALMDASFKKDMAEGYGLDGPCLSLGRPMQGGEYDTDSTVQLPLAMVTRHGLVAGATGTGKTKTLQLMAGQLSAEGVPVFIADVKGDLTGLMQPGDPAPVAERSTELAWAFTPSPHPVELLSLSGALGAQVRATIHSFGPLLLGKVLDLNKTQTSVLTMVFKYCDDAKLPLLDLEDLRTTLKFLSSDEGKPVLDEYGGMAKATLGVLLRSLVELEEAGAAGFFGEPEFDVADLMRLTPEGAGVVMSLLELSDVMERPRLFSTFMLWMLAQVYAALPEVGDLPKPKLAFFFDEAHLLFDDASDALMEQIELTARLIRSKGVGVYFVTQSPTDVPSSVLSQLGNRVQHALRSFTPQDDDNLRKTVKTMPKTDHYDVAEVLTSLGIGEAFVTVLTPRGVPTPLAATRLFPPDSMLAAIDGATSAQAIAAGSLQARYAQTVDRQSAHEIITARLNDPAGGVPLPPPPPEAPPGPSPPRAPTTQAPKAAKPPPAAKPPTPKQDDSLGEQVKDVGIGFAKDMLTTADGRRTLRTVFGTLFGKK